MSGVLDRIKYKDQTVALSEVEHISWHSYNEGEYYKVHFNMRSGKVYSIRVQTQEEKDYLLRQIEDTFISIAYNGHFQFKPIPEYQEPKPEAPEPEEQAQPEPEQPEKKKGLFGQMFN
jgi:hypothetical protein